MTVALGKSSRGKRSSSIGRGLSIWLLSLAFRVSGWPADSVSSVIRVGYFEIRLVGVWFGFKISTEVLWFWVKF